MPLSTFWANLGWLSTVWLQMMQAYINLAWVNQYYAEPTRTRVLPFLSARDMANDSLHPASASCPLSR